MVEQANTSTAVAANATQGTSVQLQKEKKTFNVTRCSNAPRRSSYRTDIPNMPDQQEFAAQYSSHLKYHNQKLSYEKTRMTRENHLHFVRRLVLEAYRFQCMCLLEQKQKPPVVAFVERTVFEPKDGVLNSDCTTAAAPSAHELTINDFHDANGPLLSSALCWEDADGALPFFDGVLPPSHTETALQECFADILHVVEMQMTAPQDEHECDSSPPHYDATCYVTALQYLSRLRIFSDWAQLPCP